MTGSEAHGVPGSMASAEARAALGDHYLGDYVRTGTEGVQAYCSCDWISVVVADERTAGQAWMAHRDQQTHTLNNEGTP